MIMDTPYYSCEDCGAAFTKTELLRDVEEVLGERVDEGDLRVDVHSPTFS